MEFKKIQKDIIAGFLFVFFVFPSAMWAETFTVTNVSQFQSDLDAASANGENDIINVAAGTYNVTMTLTYIPTENFSLTIEGDGIGSTILDGGTTTQILNILATGPDADITIRNMTFQNGRAPDYGGGLRVEVVSAVITIEESEFNDNLADGTPGDTGIGGGVSAGCTDGSIILRDSTFSNNSATNVGGAAALYTESGTITLTANSFSNNSITTLGVTEPGYDGGGVSAQTINGEITITGNDFTDNVSGDDGGGLFTYATGSGAIISVTDENNFTNNFAPLGGGGFYSRFTVDGTLTLTNNTFIENEADSGGGGGAHLEVMAGSANISENSFIHNEALGTYGDGGGIWIDSSGASLTLTSNSFTDNTATQNGGGANLFSETGSIDLANNLFDLNAATNVGGGISIATISGVLTFRNDTFYENSADDGGGVSFYSDHTPAPTLNIFNEVIWNNIPQGILELGTGTVEVTYSDIQDGLLGLGNINTDPLFVDAAGGDYHLRDSSPCIEAGTMTPDVPDADIEGNPRPNPPGSNPDMGAYENSVGGLAYIIIRDSSGGGGSEVTTRSMTTDETLDLWAAGYDSDDSFIGDQLVTWDITGTLDGVLAGPTTNVTFEPSTSGTSGTITADASGLTDATGMITVDVGGLHRIIIRDELGGGGSVVNDLTMTIEETLEVWAAGYDLDDNFIGDQSVDWEGTGVVSGNLSPTTGISTIFNPTTIGTGTIEAEDGEGHTDDTGIITVTFPPGDTDITIRPWVTSPGGDGTIVRYTTYDLWVDNECDGWWEVTDPEMYENDASIVGEVNRIYARFRNDSAVSAFNIEATFYVTANVTGANIDPNGDGDISDRWGREAGFSQISDATNVYVVIDSAFPGVTDNDDDGRVDVLEPGNEALIYVEWTPSGPAPSGTHEHRCAAVVLTPENTDGDPSNNIAQENVTRFGDDCGSLPAPYTAGAPFYYEASFYNPHYPQGGDIEIRLSLENWPDGWSAGLTNQFMREMTIHFDDKELARDVTLYMTYSQDAKPGDRGDFSVTVWLRDVTEAQGGFSVVVEVPQEKELSTITGRVVTSFAGHFELSVSGAKVSLEGTEYVVTTDSKGNFLFPEVQPGNYVLLIEAEHLGPIRQEITIQEGRSLEVSVPSMQIRECFSTWDIFCDNKVGLEDIIYALQILSGVRDEE